MGEAVVKHGFDHPDDGPDRVAGPWQIPGLLLVPALLNGFAQPASPLQQFGYRRGIPLLDFGGVLDVSGAVSGTKALVLQPKYWPVKLPVTATPVPEDQAWPVIVTDDGGATFVVGAAYVDAATGDVYVHWGSISGSGTSSIFHRIATAGVNNVSIKGSPGLVTGYYICNIASTFRYVKLFDKASAPTMGVDVPEVVLGIPPLSAANIGFDSPLPFDLGIAMAATVEIDDLDATGVGFRDLAINFYYQ